VALEALRGGGVEVPAALVAVTVALRKKVQCRRAFDARAKNRDKKIVKFSWLLRGIRDLRSQ